MGIEKLLLDRRDVNSSFSQWLMDLYESDDINESITEKLLPLAELQDGFDCARCGKCCTEQKDIELSMDDVKRALSKLGINAQQFIKKFRLIRTTYKGVGVFYTIRLEENDYCPFYNGSGCNIHDARPDVCRRFPFLTPEGISNTLQMDGGLWFYGAQCKASVEYADKMLQKAGLPPSQPDEKTRKKSEMEQ